VLASGEVQGSDHFLNSWAAIHSLTPRRLWHGPDRLEERQFAGGAEKLWHTRLIPISIRAFKLHRHEILPVNPDFIEEDGIIDPPE
jgi:hypothetical protein